VGDTDGVHFLRATCNFFVKTHVWRCWFICRFDVRTNGKQISLLVTTAPLDVGNNLQLHAYFNLYVLLCRIVLEITAASLVQPS